VEVKERAADPAATRVWDESPSRRRTGTLPAGPSEEARKMSELLEAARVQIDAGDYKGATKTLCKVEVLARYDIDEARGLLELATTVKDHGGRRVHNDCDWLVMKAEESIRSLESAHVH
jgi:hypothetical protein